MKRMQHRVGIVLAVSLALGCATPRSYSPVPGTEIDEPAVLQRLVEALGCPAEDVFAERWEDAAVAEGCGRHAHLPRNTDTGAWQDVKVVELASGDPIPTNRAMTPPKRVKGRDPMLPYDIGQRTYVINVMCVIDVDGATKDCRVTKKARPELDAMVLKVFEDSHYEPVTYRGRPVPVDYSFTVKLTGAHQPPPFKSPRH